MKAGLTGQCVLRTLENPMLNGILLGLDVRDGDLHLVTEIFPCCRGEGVRFQASHNQLIRCQLNQRLNRTRRLLAQYYQQWGDSFPRPPHHIAPQKSARLLADLAQVLKGNAAQGTILQGEKDHPGDVFAIALAAVWRYGMEAFIVNMEAGGSEQLFKRYDWQARRPVALFVSQVSRLWEPNRANEFEAVVSFAYRANAYLWVEFVEASTPKEVPGHSVKAAFSRKIGAMKAKSPWEFLETSCRSRLETLCALPRLPEGNDDYV